MGKLFSMLCGAMLLVLMVATVAAVSLTGAQIVFAMFLACSHGTSRGGAERVARAPPESDARRASVAEGVSV